MAERFKVTARFLPDGKQFTAKVQMGRTLLLLREKANRGMVDRDLCGGPPFRLPAYTWSLMRKFGLNIEIRRALHDGGWHGEFVLHTPIEIMATIDPETNSVKAA